MLGEGGTRGLAFMFAWIYELASAMDFFIRSTSVSLILPANQHINNFAFDDFLTR
jgi:hypothetical protein